MVRYTHKEALGPHLVSSHFEKEAYSHIRTVIFGGGGARGRVYPEVVRLFCNQYGGDIRKIQKVYGTSVGAIAALLIAVGIPPEEGGNVLQNMNLQSFQNFSWNPITMIKRIWYQGSLFTSDGMIDSVSQILHQFTGRADMTFAQLRAYSRWAGYGEKDLKVIATDITTGKPKIFSADTTPDVTVAYAVSRSAAVPGAYPIDEDLTDGGIVANYPIHIAVEEAEAENALLPEDQQLTRKEILDAILGFAVIDSDTANSLFEKGPKKPSGFLAILKRIVSLIFHRDLLHMPDDIKARTIFIHTKNINPTRFVITKEEQMNLNQMAVKALEFHVPREVIRKLKKNEINKMAECSLSYTLQALSDLAYQTCFNQNGEHVYSFKGEDALHMAEMALRRTYFCPNIADPKIIKEKNNAYNLIFKTHQTAMPRAIQTSTTTLNPPFTPAYQQLNVGQAIGLVLNPNTQEKAPSFKTKPICPLVF